jgi:flagellar assembly protein FliH
MGRLMKSFGRVVPAETMNARVEAAEIRAAARRDAEGLVARAQEEAATICAEAARAGNAAGHELARAEFRELLLSATREAERIRRAAVPSARTLAIRMAERIVRRAVALEPRVLDEIVEGALVAAGAITAAVPGAERRHEATSRSPERAAGAAGTVVVRVHPDDLVRLAADRERLMARLDAGLELRLLADASVDRAGCIVDTPRGRLDARLPTQLAVLERAALGAAATGDAKRG